jgi:hypothetical protein
MENGWKVFAGDPAAAFIIKYTSTEPALKLMLMQPTTLLRRGSTGKFAWREKIALYPVKLIDHHHTINPSAERQTQITRIGFTF